MPGRTRYPVSIFLVILFILLQVCPVMAQQQPFLDKRVSFTFTATPLANALRAIGNKTGVKFSYNPELIQPGKRISVRFSNMLLRDVLKQLLSDPSLSFREIGNQIVIYRGDPSQFPLEPNQQLIQGKPQIVVSTKKTPDTIFMYQLDTLIINRRDTILRSISITRFDTIRLTDTVYIEKNKSTQKAGKEVKNNFDKNSVKHRKFLENNGFYSGLYLEMLSGSAAYKSTSATATNFLTLMQQADAGWLSKFSAGVVAGYDYHKVGIRTGVGFTYLGEKFDYSYVLETGGLFRTDTVEKYYSVAGIDTSWFFITDSTWIPKSDKNYTYRNPNSFRYIDIPLTVKLRFWQNQSAEIYALGGVNAAFLVSVDAWHIDPDNIKSVLKTQTADLNPVIFSWHAGIGTAVKLSSQAGIMAEATYRKQTNSQYKDFPLTKNYGLIGIKIGAFVKF